MSFKLGDFVKRSFVSPPGLCRKQRHPSRGAAEAAIRSLYKRGMEGKNGLHAYHCPRCQGYHIGH